MDQDFAGFLEDFGPGFDKQHVPPSSIARYRGKLPNQLLSYWEEHGWCGYADGLFWTVNPQEYEPALEAWIGDTPFMAYDAYHLIARGAFGELYFWGEKTGNSLRLFAAGSYCIPRNSRLVGEKMDFGMQVFFGGLSRDGNDFDGMFVPALKKLGRLKHDEMYGFIPALGLGGSSTLDHLHKVKAVEHLVLLAQLAPLEVITSPPP
ncbi:MAG: GAD-like domain-containing protein [Pseudomonadota bacterium]